MDKNKNIKVENLDDKNLKDALIKRALGFEAVDEVKEYSVDENEKLKLTKKKITKKFVSPDISAAKTLLEYYFNDNKNELENMTDEELIEEKKRLLKLLECEEKNINTQEGEIDEK